MDADRFDTLTRTMGTPSSRRVALGATLAGGLLGALGLARSVPEVAAQGGTCTLALAANVRLGPSQGQPLVSQGQLGALQGNLLFGVDQTGRLTGELQVPSGERFPVMGQATGRSLQARIELAPRVALVVMGVGEQEIAACRGAIDGVASGPQAGDLGDWHAIANGGGGQGRGGQGGSGQNADDSAPRGGRDTSGGRTDRGGDGGGGGGRKNQDDGTASGGNAGGTQGGSGGGNNADSVSNAPSCPEGETYCAYVEECRNLGTSSLDCGACGNRCPSLVCQEGRCLSEEEADSRGSTGLECDPGETICDGRCVYLQTDPDNCGTCGNACDFNVASCQDGICVFRPGENCPTGLIGCGAICVDTTSDPANCSACGIACPAGEECRGSLCVPVGGGGGCKTGLIPCGTTCVDPGSDNANCGGCGLACAAGTTCVIGACIPEGSGGGGCKTGFTGCGGVCVDLNSDPNNCGGCGFGCVDGAICEFGTCTPITTEAPPPLTCADQGLIECFGVCVDLQSDPSNCGFCGEVCPSGQCATGICVEVVGPAPAEVACPTGQADCGGGCIDVFTDPANCGFCGNVCAADQQCLLGGCTGGIDLDI